jgi:transcriptional regulator of NAD metabolism
VDYLHDPATQLLRLRQVIVEHRGWIYAVTYTAPSTTYSASLPALAQVISSWH